jgi:MFS family permease
VAVLCRDEAVLGQEDRGSRLGPFGERRFRLLYAARASSFIGSTMAPIGLAFAVLDTLHGSRTELGLVLAARAIPNAAFILLGGVIADRLPRHLVMVTSNVASMATQGAVAALLLTGNAEVWQLIVLSALNALRGGGADRRGDPAGVRRTRRQGAAKEVTDRVFSSRSSR